MRNFLYSSALVLAMLPGMAQAQDLSRGVAAYHSGDYPTAQRELRPLAEAGDAEAQALIGVMYALGAGVTTDLVESARWYRLAAEQGNAQAQFGLGVLYESGFGVPRDYREAEYWYQLAAAQDFPGAQSRIDLMYASGALIPEEEGGGSRSGLSEGAAAQSFELGMDAYEAGDYRAAFLFLEAAAENNHALAQAWVGYFYEMGYGTEPDMEQAWSWYERAVAQSQPDAQYNLGMLLANGNGVPHDDTRAFQLITYAAQQDHALAQLEMARRFAEGRGVELDRKAATIWAVRAADQGNAEAAALLEQLRAQPMPAVAECGSGGRVFSCMIGSNVLELCHHDNVLTYSYGPAGAPELTLSAPLASIPWEPWNGMSQLITDEVTFTNGAWSYSFMTVADRAGRMMSTHLTVSQNGTTQATLHCNPGSESSPLHDTLRPLMESIGR